MMKRLSLRTALAMTLTVVGCATANSNPWLEITSAALPVDQTMQIAGTIERIELEGGIYVIRDEAGGTFQPTNLPEAFRKNGLAIDAVAQRSESMVSIGMIGTLIDLVRIRTRVDTPAATPATAVDRRVAHVSGTVAYRERMALPPNAVIDLVLSDVSRADAAALVIAQTTITPAGQQVPLAFDLPYDAAAIVASHEYAMRATISNEGALLFTTDTRYAVITRGNPTSVDLMLVRTTR